MWILLKLHLKGLLEVVSLWDLHAGCSSLLPALAVWRFVSPLMPEKCKNIKNGSDSYIPPRCGITSMFTCRFLSSNVTKTNVRSWCECWSGVVAAEQFCLSSLKPTLWKNYPEGRSGCSLEICSIWCGCKYWLFYGNGFGWLVCSHNVYLDLIMDVCMLQNDCRVTWGTWIIITIIILNNPFFHFLPTLAALNERMCITSQFTFLC